MKPENLYDAVGNAPDRLVERADNRLNGKKAGGARARVLTVLAAAVLCTAALVTAVLLIAGRRDTPVPPPVDSDTAGTRPDDTAEPGANDSEAPTQAETQDLYADVSVKGHTLKKTADGAYCIKPTIEPKKHVGAIVVADVICRDRDDLRSKLLNGGFTDADYQAMYMWPKTEDGILLPDPNNLKDVSLPDDWKALELLLMGRAYYYLVENEPNTMFAFVRIIPDEQYQTEYDSIKSMACVAVTKPGGTEEEGTFNGIPCTVYEYISQNNAKKFRGHWINLSTDKEELYASLTYSPESPSSSVMLDLVGKTEDGTAYTISFHSKAYPEILETYTADFFRSFRPVP